MPDSTLRSFTAHDGSNLAVVDWPLPSGAPSRGLVVIVHGLGEHAGRYDHVAERLNSWGFAAATTSTATVNPTASPVRCQATPSCWTTWPSCWTPRAGAWTRACPWS
jgi:predicted alpha/beta hydrolase